MGEKKKFSLLSCILTVICVIFVAEAAAPVASIGNSQYLWWIFMIILFLLPYGLISSELGTTFDNGGGLYDFEKREYIWAQMLADGVDELLSAVEERVPTVGFQVNTLKNCYFCKENVIMERFRRGTGLPNLTADHKSFSEPICRALFGCETEEEIVEVEKILRSHPRADDFFFIRSEKVLFEIVPKGMNKGVSITRLAEYLNLDPKKTVAIGDYNNDIPMFKVAGLSIAVENACADAKAAADFITVSNLDHAVARVIYDLEKGVYPI